jgi:hypothetical protein
MDKTLADSSWTLPISKTPLLTEPETHLYACFYGMSVCRDSGYDLLKPKGSAWEVGTRLSDDLNDKMRMFLADVSDDDKAKAGFVVEISGVVLYSQKDSEGNDETFTRAHCGDEVSIVGFNGKAASSEASGGVATVVTRASLVGAVAAALVFV